MRMSRTMSTGIIRLFSLFSVMMVVLSLLPMLSHAAVFWDDELEAGTPFGVSFSIASGAMAYDTAVKFSGSGSIRLNYPSSCQTLTTGKISVADQRHGQFHTRTTSIGAPIFA